MAKQCGNNLLPLGNRIAKSRVAKPQVPQVANILEWQNHEWQNNKCHEYPRVAKPRVAKPRVPWTIQTTVLLSAVYPMITTTTTTGCDILQEKKEKDALFIEEKKICFFLFQENVEWVWFLKNLKILKILEKTKFPYHFFSSVAWFTRAASVTLLWPFRYLIILNKPAVCVIDSSSKVCLVPVMHNNEFGWGVFLKKWPPL